MVFSNVTGLANVADAASGVAHCEGWTETCLIDSVRSSFHTYHCTTFGIWLDTASATSAAPIGWLIGIYQCPSYALTFFVVFAHADAH